MCSDDPRQEFHHALRERLAAKLSRQVRLTLKMHLGHPGVIRSLFPSFCWRMLDYDSAKGETMRNLAGGLALLLLAASSPLVARAQTDDEAVRKLPQAFCDAWAKHDGHQLAIIMADDVDFANVGANWLHGRSDFEKYHSRLLGGRFKEATLTLLQTEVRFLQPDMAVVHWSWKIAGDKNFDGTPRPQRFGLMTMVAQRRNRVWQVVVAQNTNAMPGTPPEIQALKLR